MKSIKISFSIFILLLIFAIFQVNGLINLREYDKINLSAKNDENIFDISEMLILIEDENCEILNVKHDKETWNGSLVFSGNLDELEVYINRLKENNIYIKNYRFEKIEELKCFLEIKSV